jgi:hypothetical protein
MAKKKESPRIAFRLTEREKKQAAGLAARCGLSLSEYLRQRALGFEPKAIQPDTYSVFCEKLDKLTEPPFSEAVLLGLALHGIIYLRLDKKRIPHDCFFR